MTVLELIEELKNYPDDLEVILQRDPEGNGYAPLSGAEDAKQIEYEECHSNPEDYEEYYEEPYVPNCVVLWPQW